MSIRLKSKRERVYGTGDGLNAMTGEHHVLIVEDDPRTAELHTSMLRREGYEVAVAREVVSRIDLAGSWLPDAAILEVTSPGWSSAATIAPIESGQW